MKYMKEKVSLVKEKIVKIVDQPLINLAWKQNDNKYIPIDNYFRCQFM